MAFFHSNFMLQTPHPHHQEQEDDHNNNHNPSCNNLQEFHGGGHGVASLLGKRSSMSLISTGIDASHDININHGDQDELSDEGSQLGGDKKRRLNIEQVKTLERNFELGNKLEPERKMQLARALGLQPRQIAIWFQNRRARWKTKQLEKDYNLLKRQFESAKAQNDALLSQNQKLHAQILALKNREPTESINLNKETEDSSSNRSENSLEIKIAIARNEAIESPLSSEMMRASSSSMMNRASGLFQGASRPEIQGPKMEQSISVKEESFCNMFCGMDDQTGLWPWLEQHNFN